MLTPTSVVAIEDVSDRSFSTGNFYHPDAECLPASLAQEDKHEITLSEFDPNCGPMLLCYACGEPILDDSDYDEFFHNENGGCDCSACDATETYALAHGDVVMINGFGQGYIGYHSIHGLTIAQYATNLGYTYGDGERPRFIRGYLAGQKTRKEGEK